MKYQRDEPETQVMRAPGVRVSIRSVMILVAMAALFLSAARLWRLRATYQQQAASHNAQEVNFRKREAWAARVLERRYMLRHVVEDLRKRAEYHAALSQAYQRAAAYPWLPLPPDPPEPK